MNYTLTIIGIATLIVASCSDQNNKADAFGNFEAKEILIASEVSGRITSISVQEGQTALQGEIAVQIDSVQNYLKVNELKAKKEASVSKITNVKAQVEVYEKQKALLEKDRVRISNMFQDGAATQKQVDDLNGQIDVIESQINLVKTNLAAINAEIAAYETGISQAADMLAKTQIYFPANGTVVQRYAEPGEIAAPGKALLKLADLKNMELRAYVSGKQLSGLKLGQKVTVKVDNQLGKYSEYRGTISWISTEAEFTPKNIQTKEERLSQVYAIKILVENDGLIRINMPGEVLFTGE